MHLNRAVKLQSRNQKVYPPGGLVTSRFCVRPVHCHCQSNNNRKSNERTQQQNPKQKRRQPTQGRQSESKKNLTIRWQRRRETAQSGRQAQDTTPPRHCILDRGKPDRGSNLDVADYLHTVPTKRIARVEEHLNVASSSSSLDVAIVFSKNKNPRKCNFHSTGKTKVK